MLDMLIAVIVGHSIASLVILLLAYLFFLPDAPRTKVGVIACIALIVALVGLQWLHLLHLGSGKDLLGDQFYVAMLFTTPPTFYFFSRSILMTDAPVSLVQATHLLPIFASIWIPPAFVGPVAFALGAGYSIWLAWVVYGMRRHIERFRFEMFFFGLFAIQALVVLVLVMLVPALNASTFYIGYSVSIGVAVALIVSALLIFPDIIRDVSDTARLTYARSTLASVDVDNAIVRFERLLNEEKVHFDEALNLNKMAQSMGLTSHQLSELVNSRYGVGFSRLVRERRVQEAKRLLQEDRRSSVLSIGLTVGFGSQSSFYSAFREVTGESPASFRKAAQGMDSIPR